MGVELELGKRIAERGCKEALAFFRPPDDWEIRLYALAEAPSRLAEDFSSTATAGVNLSHHALIARIVFGPERVKNPCRQ